MSARADTDQPRSPRRVRAKRTELGRASAQASRRLAGDGAQGARETAALLEGAALLTGRLALSAFTCAAAFSLAVMLVAASWADGRSARNSLTLQGDEEQ